MNFSKIDPGRLILDSCEYNHQHVPGRPNPGGALHLRDSQALGSNNPIVSSGASLELQADGIPDSVGFAGLYNIFLSQSISIAGNGLNSEGALFNISGSNRIDGNVVLNGGAAIGVAPDPDPFNVQLASWNLLSQLTINGVLNGGILTKVGHGELVLTNANTYTGPTGQNQYQTFIKAGWITVKNNQALGSTNYNVNVVDKPGVQVTDGGALVLTYDKNGNYLILPYNMSLNGTGITHRFSWLDQKGALLNLDRRQHTHGRYLSQRRGGHRRRDRRLGRSLFESEPTHPHRHNS